MGDQPISHDASGHRGLILNGCSVDCRSPRKPPEKIPTPPGRGLRRRLLRRAPKPYYQLLSGHVTIGPYLKDKIGRATDDMCWWCGGRKQQTRHHLFTVRRARLPQIRKLWKEIGKAQGWKHLRAPWGKWLWKKPTEAVLVFLKSTRVGCVGTRRKLPQEGEHSLYEEAGAGDAGGEGGPGPPGV